MAIIIAAIALYLLVTRPIQVIGVAVTITMAVFEIAFLCLISAVVIGAALIVMGAVA